MAECKHENQYLIGTATGITCRRCGASFKTFAEINPAPAEPAEAEASEKPKPKRTRKKSAE